MEEEITKILLQNFKGGEWKQALKELMELMNNDICVCDSPNPSVCYKKIIMCNCDEECKFKRKIQ